MKQILLCAPERGPFEEMIRAFEIRGVKTEYTVSTRSVLEKLASGQFQLLVCSDRLADMSGKALVEQAVMQNPMINCVVSSTDNAKQFHETYEGLGVLMQFPEKPGQENIDSLMAHLAKISALSPSSS